MGEQAGGDTIGQIIIMDLNDEERKAFEAFLLSFQHRNELKKWTIDTEPMLSLSGLEINLSNRKVVCNGQEIKLTVKEYDLLCLLAANKGRVLTYAQIYDKVWGDLPSGNEKDTVGYHIRNLRRKICLSASAPAISIESVREVGYRFDSA